jgi:hypothetical protein
MNAGDTVYIAGPMRKFFTECFNFKRFFFWQVKLEESGYNVINPALIDCQRWIDDGWPRACGLFVCSAWVGGQRGGEEGDCRG